jgi:hypothetical protein
MKLKFKMKYLFLTLSTICLALLFTTCETTSTADLPIDDDMMTITLNNLKPVVNLSVVNGRVATTPEDQDTLYVGFRYSFRSDKPDFLFKLSPIPESHTFKLPRNRAGYDVFVCTYPNKLFKVAETWDMPKHIWVWQRHDVGETYSGSLNPELDIELKRLSSNLIVKKVDGQQNPNDYNIKSIKLMIDAVFNNYHPQWGHSFGLYERKWIQLWPTTNDDFGWKNICMGLKDPYDSLGTFEFVIEREKDGQYPQDWIAYRKQFQVVGGKTTIIEIDLEQIGIEELESVIGWTDEEEEIYLGK